MADLLTCPDRATILRSLSGGDSSQEIDRIAAHLEECPACGAVLDSLLHDNETVVALREGTVVSESDSKALRALHQRLAGLVFVARPADQSDPTVGLGAVPSESEAEVALTFLRPSQQPDEIGRLGTYRVLKLLGAGGMGMVFLAEDTLLGRKVALKTMLPAVAKNPQNKERFLREARIAAAIEHPHIVAIFQVGEDNGVPFVAMPFLKGESLEDRLRRCGKLPVAEAVRIADEMAEGLAAAHAEGLIHRDIKPGNVWLESQPGRGKAEGTFKVKLLDFGLARSLTDDTHLTQTGTIVGTPAFMSPEQARGETVDGRADLFSLGCVLYTMLTGDRPFRGENTMSLLMALGLDTPKAPHEANLDCSPELSQLTMQLLEKEPKKRPASASAVVDALARIQDKADATEQIAIPAKPRTTPKVKPRKRRLLPLVAFGALLAFVGVGILFGGTIFRIATNKGELVIEVEDKDVEVKILRDGIVVQDKTSKREFTLTAGKGEIEVLEKDGIKLATKKFELTRNGKTTVRVTAGELAEARDPNSKTKPLLASGGPDRKAAEWVLSIGGTVRINGQDQEIKVAADLPKEAFQLMSVHLNDNKQVSDAGLACFKGCTNLTGLHLDGTKVNDVGLAHFKDCKNLTYLGLNLTKVGDAGLAHLKDCKNLTVLALHGTKVSDMGLAHFKNCKNLAGLDLNFTNVGNAGLAHFKDCKNLTYLGLLRATQVSDAGLAHLKDCKNLTGLHLDGTKVSDVGLAHFKDYKNLTGLALNFTKVGDAGLAHLKDCKNLTSLYLRKTKVTAAKIEELKKALPACKIEWDGGVIEPKPSLDPDRKAAEWVLSIGGLVRVNGQDRDIKAAADLPKEAYRLTYVFLPGGQVTDEGLAPLKDCQSLTNLVMYDSVKVGEAGMAHLKGCKSLTYLELHLTNVGDAGMAHLKECKELKKLFLFGPRVTDAGMAHMKEIKGLTDFRLDNMSVGDAGMAHLKGCKELKHLSLHCPRVTDAGMAHMKEIKGLIELRLHNMSVGDAGMAHLKECIGLQSLYLTGVQVTDAGMVHIKECIGLQSLYLSGVQVTDAGMVHIKEIKSLGHLTMENVQVSDAGLKTLARLPNRPQCVDSKDTRISKLGYERMQVARPNFLRTWSETNRSVAEQVLALGGSVTIGTPGKDDARPVKAAADLPPTFFQVRRVSLAGVKKPLDDLVITLGLLRFAEFDRLEAIDLSGTKPPYLTALTSVAGLRELSLSGAGLNDDWFANFPKLPTLRRLVIDGNAIGAPGLARLKQLPELRELSLSGPTITDLLFQNLAEMKKLTKLSLVGSPLTDDSVQDLKVLTALTELDLRKTKVTAAGIAELKKALPKCKIESGGDAKGK